MIEYNYFIFYLFFFLLFSWFFALISISGLFSVTFSVVFAYVADLSDEKERSRYYGWVGVYLITSWCYSSIFFLNIFVQIFF